jgi:hypothetical protein
VLLLNWKDNDLGLKAPETSSLIIDKTRKLKYILEDSYLIDTKYFLVPSHNPQTKVQKLIEIRDDISDKKEAKKIYVLRLVYYNRHRKLI